MSNFQPKGLRNRALLADVLPFEVPIIFTNDLFFASTSRIRGDPQTSQAIALLREADGFTIPYNYNIIKDRGRTTQLSIIHPIVQLGWAEFVDNYAETIIAYCNKTHSSLRHPFALVSQHANAPLEKEATARDGLPHELLEDNAQDFSRMASYFRLRRYNVIAKFFDSNEMIDLERRYSHMLALDISKCFYNIYTHSISWAVKTKSFAKSQLGAYTFEDQFDQLMQAANYKETNGIVVGPEISRIFAEIIFQEIDKSLHERLTSGGLSEDKFAVRRYVDDYFIFGNRLEDVELIERTLAELLGEYKLYLNVEKRQIWHRPFVSPISRLKQQIAEIIDSVGAMVRHAASTAEFCEHRSVVSDIRQKLKDLRLAVSPSEVGFHNVSGWLMWKLRRICRDATSYMSGAQDDVSRDCAAQITAAIMNLAFYVAALDFRVRTGFNLALLVTSVLPALQPRASEQAEWLHNLIFEEIVDLLEIVINNRPIESVELCNLLLTGAHEFGERFVRTRVAKRAIFQLANESGKYRSYITAKFCMLKDPSYYNAWLGDLNDRTEIWLNGKMALLKRDAETYLLFCDMLSSPDLTLARKAALLNAALAPAARLGKIGAVTLSATAEVGRLIGFVDWTGVRLRHTLIRRQLRSSREY